MSKQAFKRVRRALHLEVCREPLPAYAWPGGYPIIYICSDGSVLCPDCVNKEIDQIDPAIRQRLRDGWRIDATAVNYEDSDCYCDHCGHRIEPAYGD